jgi:hypothetical protein
MSYPKQNDDGQCEIKIYRCQECDLEGATKEIYPTVGLHNPRCPSCGAPKGVKLIRAYRYGASE